MSLLQKYVSNFFLQKPIKIFLKIREWKEKFDLADDEEEDTLTYHYRNKYIFRPDLSAPGLTGDEIVVMAHPGKNCNHKFRPKGKG